MADNKSRLEVLLEKQAKLAEDIVAEKNKGAAVAVLEQVQGTVAQAIREALKAASMDVALLDGQAFNLTVTDGVLSVTVGKAANGKKAASSNGGNGGNGGNGHYEYWLKDGRGPYATIQATMDAMSIAKANRPKHDRYDRLSADWQGKIVRKEKVEAPAVEAVEAPAVEAPAA